MTFCVAVILTIALVEAWDAWAVRSGKQASGWVKTDRENRAILRTLPTYPRSTVVRIDDGRPRCGAECVAGPPSLAREYVSPPGTPKGAVIRYYRRRLVR